MCKRGRYILRFFFLVTLPHLFAHTFIYPSAKKSAPGHIAYFSASRCLLFRLHCVFCLFHRREKKKKGVRPEDTPCTGWSRDFAFSATGNVMSGLIITYIGRQCTYYTSLQNTQIVILFYSRCLFSL